MTSFKGYTASLLPKKEKWSIPRILDRCKWSRYIYILLYTVELPCLGCTEDIWWNKVNSKYTWQWLHISVGVCAYTLLARKQEILVVCTSRYCNLETWNTWNSDAFFNTVIQDWRHLILPAPGCKNCPLNVHHYCLKWHFMTWYYKITVIL